MPFNRIRLLSVNTLQRGERVLNNPLYTHFAFRAFNMRQFQRLLFSLLAVQLLVTPAVAQEDPPAASDDADEASMLERMIYVPYRKLRDVFDKQDASVVVPYADYLKMLEKMTEPKGTKPLDGVITQANYTTTIEGDVARVAVELKVLVTGKAWVRVPVAFGDAAIGKIESDKGKVLLQGIGDGKYELLFSESGEHTVKMEIVARVRTSPQGRSLVLNTPRVGITNFELTIPKADQSVDLMPKQVVQTLDAEGDTTRVKANIGSTAQIVANWIPRASAKPQMDLLTSVSNQLQVRIDEGLIHRTAKMKFNVLRGEMSELSFVVPANDRLLDVTSSGNQVRKWTSKKEDNRQIVTVQLLAPTEDDVTLEVRTEQNLPEGEIQIGGIAADGTVNGIHALQVVRESGELAVVSNKNLAVNIVQQQRVTRTSQTSNGFAWRFYGSDMQVAITASTIEPRVVVQQSAMYNITDDNELRVSSRFTYNVERAGVFELSLTVPDGLAIDNVSGPIVSDFNVADDQLTITLTAKKLGQFAILVEGRTDFAEAMQNPKALPFLKANDVARETGAIAVKSPPAIEVVTDEDSVSGLFPNDNVSAQQTARVGSSWTYNKTPIAMSASLRRKPPRLTAFATTGIDVQPKVITVKTQLRFDIQNAGIDTFRFSVPEAFADSLRITSPEPIKQRTREDAVDGWVTWTVVMQQKSQSSAVLDVEYDLTTVQEDADAAADNNNDDEPTEVESQVEPIRVLAAGPDAEIEPVQVKGEVAIGKDHSLSVSAEPTGEDIETIDVRELGTTKTEATLAFRYFTQDATVTLKAVKYAIKSVVETVVNRAAVEVQLGHDPMATYLCRYVITSSERQRLQIDLPAEAELLDQTVDGTRISLTPLADGVNTNGWESFYANFGTAVSGAGANKSFVLTIQFRAAIAGADSEPFSDYRGSQRIRIPRIGGEGSAVVVQELRTAVWVPKDYALVGQPDKFARNYESWFANSWPLRLVRDSGRRQLDDWIGSKNSGMVDFPRKGHSYIYTSMGRTDDLNVQWWNMPFSVWVISGAIFLVGFVLRKTPWENKLTFILIVAFVAVLYALKDQETVMQSLFAGSYGLMAVLILWTIYALRRPADSSPTKPGGSSRGSSPPPPDSDPTPPTPKPGPTPAAAIAVSPPPGAIDSMNKMMGGK